MVKLPKIDHITHREYLSPEEKTVKEKAAYAQQLMAQQGLILDKQRIFDRWVLRLRRKSDLVPVWTKRGMNDKTLLTEMIRWLKSKNSL